MTLPSPPPDVDLQDTQVPRILGVNIATFILAVIAISLRFIARRLTRLPYWWDDWLMLPAIVCWSECSISRPSSANGAVGSGGHYDVCDNHL